MDSIKKGEEYWVNHPRLKEPKKGKVIALTTNLTKQVGVQFDENIKGHSCDGRGEEGYCLWVRAVNILDQTAYEELARLRALSMQHQAEISSDDELDELPIL